VYTQKAGELDSTFSQRKNLSISTVLQVDSDVTRSMSKIVFFAHDQNQRYKVTAPPNMEVEFLDCVFISGKISLPEIKSFDKKEIETVYQFPYKQYLAKDDVYVLMQIKEWEKVRECTEVSKYELIQKWFIGLKNKLTEIFLTEYEHPYAGLVAGVLVAGKGLMDSDTLEIFKRTSLSHVVVLSGSNVSLILICIKLLVDRLFFWKWIKKIIVLLAVWAFVLLTGGGAPIYRAAASAFCGMVLFDNKTSQIYALTVVIFILTIINPFQTFFDPSFHLTCCATYGLILFSKPIETKIRLSVFRSISKSLREIISVTLATQVFVFPYILAMTGSFSSVFLLSNVLVLPMIPFIMLFGFVTMVGGLMGMGWLVSLSVFINNFILKSVFWIVGKLAAVPYGYVQIGKGWSVGVLIAYFLLLFSIFIKSKKKQTT
jgi:competence protein ComEC